MFLAISEWSTLFFLDSRCIDNGDADKSGLHVLATSEIGVCYFWYAKNMEDLHDIKT